MRLIAVLGVLFVLASCSDMDINGDDTFGLSCVFDLNGKQYHFAFDGNTVTRYFQPLEPKTTPEKYKIISDSNVSPLVVVFEGKEMFYKVDYGSYIVNMRYMLDKTSLRIYQETLSVTDDMGNTVEWDRGADNYYYYCVTSKI